MRSVKSASTGTTFICRKICLIFFITNAIEGYKKAFCYKGVADRKTWLSFTLFLLNGVLLELILLFLAISLDGNDYLDQVDVVVIILIFVGGLAALIVAALWTFLAELAMSVRRLHDIGLSGWWVILIFCVIFIALAFGGMLAGTTSADPELFNSVVYYVVWLGSHLLLGLPKSKIENNKYRPADSISIPATDEAVS